MFNFGKKNKVEEESKKPVGIVADSERIAWVDRGGKLVYEGPPIETLTLPVMLSPNGRFSLTDDTHLKWECDMKSEPEIYPGKLCEMSLNNMKQFITNRIRGEKERPDDLLYREFLKDVAHYVAVYRHDILKSDLPMDIL